MRPRRTTLALALPVFWAVTSCVANPLPTGGASAGTAAGTGSGADGGVLPGQFGGENCGTRSCDVFDCGLGYHAETLSGECCPSVCEPDDCTLADCPRASCPTGFHSTTSDRMCCAQCVQNAKAAPGETCETGQQAYEDYRAQTAASLGAALCTADSDCRILVTRNACSNDCGAAVNGRLASSLQERLESYAETHCAACPTATPTCPVLERFAYCTGGVCSLH